MHSDNLVEINGVNFWYDKRRPILSGIDMAIPRGKVFGLSCPANSRSGASPSQAT